MSLNSTKYEVSDFLFQGRGLAKAQVKLQRYLKTSWSQTTQQTRRADPCGCNATHRRGQKVLRQGWHFGPRARTCQELCRIVVKYSSLVDKRSCAPHPKQPASQERFHCQSFIRASKKSSVSWKRSWSSIQSGWRKIRRIWVVVWTDFGGKQARESFYECSSPNVTENPTNQIKSKQSVVFFFAGGPFKTVRSKKRIWCLADQRYCLSSFGGPFSLLAAAKTNSWHDVYVSLPNSLWLAGPADGSVIFLARRLPELIAQQRDAAAALRSGKCAFCSNVLGVQPQRRRHVQLCLKTDDSWSWEHLSCSSVGFHFQ